MFVIRQTRAEAQNREEKKVLRERGLCLRFCMRTVLLVYNTHVQHYFATALAFLRMSSQVKTSWDITI